MDDKLNLLGPEEMADPAISAKRLHEGERCPFYEDFDPPFYIASRYEDVNALLLDPDTWLCGLGHGPRFEPPVGLVSDAPQHTYFRRLVQDAFKPGAIAGLRPRLEEIATGLLDAVAEKEEWDLHDDLSFPLPITIICEMLGIPTDDVWPFKHWSDAYIAALSAEDASPYQEDMEKLRVYLLDLLAQYRQGDPEDPRLLARIAHARRDGEPISDAETISFILQLFVAGNETTTSLITNFMWRMLRAEGMWADFCTGKIDMDKAINESLRYDPPILGLYRTTAHEVELGGTTLPANAKLMTHYGAANRDPAVWPDPDVFDVDRPIRKVTSFGLGIHFCLGAELAKLEAQVALSALAKRFPNLELINDGERVGPFLFWGRKKLPVRNG